MSSLLMAKELEEEVLKATFNDPRVKVTGKLFYQGIEIGVPDEEPLCVIVPVANHRAKYPVGFGYFNPLDEDSIMEQVQLVNYHFRTDIYDEAYERGGDKSNVIDIIAIVNDLLDKERDIDVIAYSTNGCRISVEHDDEFHVMIGNTVIAEIISSLPRSGVGYKCIDGDKLNLIYHGVLYSVVCPELANANEFVFFTRNMMPSIMSAANSKDNRH